MLNLSDAKTRISLDLEGGCPSPQFSLQLNKTNRALTHGNKITSTKTGNLQSRVSTSICFPNILGTQTVRELETYNRSQSPERIYRGSSISDDFSLLCCRGHFSTSLGIHNRPSRCIPAYSYTQVSSQIPGILLQQRALLFQGTSVRFECSPLHFHQANALASLSTAFTWLQNNGLSRRLDNLGLVPCKDYLCSISNYSVPPVSRISDKLSEITNHSFSKLQMVRYSMEYSNGQVEHSRGQTTKDLSQSSPNSGVKFNHQKRVGTTNWAIEFCNPNSQTPPTLTATSPETPTFGLSQRERHSLQSSSKFETASEEVDGSPYITRISALPSCSKTHLFMDGCIPKRVGSTHRLSTSIRELELNRNEHTHQLSGSTSSVVCHKSSKISKHSAALVHRQSGGSVCYKQAKMQISVTTPRNTPAITEVSPAKHINPGNTHLLNFEFKSRCSQQTHKPTSCLDPTTVCVQGNSRLERSITNRPDGHQREQENSSVYLSVSRYPSSSQQRSVPGLEQLEGDLCFPTEVVNPSDNEETGPISSPRGDNSSLVSSRTLVCSNSNQSNQEVTLKHSRSKEEWTTSIRTMDRLQFLKAALEEHHSQDVASQLMKAYRDSTNRQSQSVWRSFQSWLPVGTKILTENLVLQFLIYLAQTKNLSPRTILNYRSCLARPLRVALNLNLNSEAFELLARSQFLQNPPKRKIVPSWSIDAVIETFSNPPFLMNDISLENLLLKTLFLTALASGNRSSELAATIREGTIISQDKVVLPVHRSFLFKNQTANNSLPPIITFPTIGKNNELCPGAFLKLYLERTNDKEHRGFIFINPVSFKPLQAGRLSFWLAKAIKRGDNSTSKPSGHDTRKMGHSIAFIRGEDPSTIIKNGYWHSPNVFIHKYLISNNVRTNKPFVAGRLATIGTDS